MAPARAPGAGALAAGRGELRHPEATGRPEDEPRYRATEVVTDRRSEELDRVLEQWEAEQRLKDAAALDAREAALREREAELRERELELRERETETPPVDES